MNKWSKRHRLDLRPQSLGWDGNYCSNGEQRVERVFDPHEGTGAGTKQAWDLGPFPFGPEIPACQLDQNRNDFLESWVDGNDKTTVLAVCSWLFWMIGGDDSSDAHEHVHDALLRDGAKTVPEGDDDLVGLEEAALASCCAPWKATSELDWDQSGRTSSWPNRSSDCLSLLIGYDFV